MTSKAHLLKIPCTICKVDEPGGQVPFATRWETGIGWICRECEGGVVGNGLQALDQTDGIRPELAIVRSSRPKV
jgi:hypothetical protein